MSKDEYNEFFMGNDGQHTMFIDLVENNFAVSSTWSDRYPIMDNIVDMFNKVREVSGNAGIKDL